MIQRLIPIALTLGLTAMVGCTPDPKDIDEVLTNLDQYAGKRILLKTSFRSGARCRIGEEEGEWKTYCKGDCQYCRGPIVVDSAVKPIEAGLDDWPMVVGGLHDGKPMKCQGPLNHVKCAPFELGKTYVVRGIIEKQTPPRLMVKDFWEAEDD